MKKVNFVFGILFSLLVSFSFLIAENNVVVGQTTTEKTCTELKSSQTFYFNICADNGYNTVCFNKFTGEYQGCGPDPNTINGEGCIENNVNAAYNVRCPVASVTLSTKFTGIWKTEVKSSSPASSIITFKLCVRDGKLEGTVQQGGAFLNGVIKEQTIISENEVDFTAQSQDGKTARIHLKLTGDRQFTGTFADGRPLEGRKLNENRGCLALEKSGKP